jgi:flavin-dependent dehydrogenase
MDTSDHDNIQFDVIIVGGGLAGLTSAIHLSSHQLRILVIEKNKFPTHKVCGEYISNEVLPYLEFLGIDPFELGAKKIKKFELSTANNQNIDCPLPLGGFGISRYKIDSALAEKAISKGVKIFHETVMDIQFTQDAFTVITKENSKLHSRFVIGAYGKRSGIDIKLDRRFIRKRSPFLAVKTHVNGEFPDDLVGLHNFEGGYCGASKVEDGSINLCYITDFKAFKKYRNIESFQKEVIFKNKSLKNLFENSKPVFNSPLTISQISFSSKNPVEQHILMCGDTAGLIHPLCGNGMSMAIRSAQIASQLIIRYFNAEIKSRTILEKQYQKAWSDAFKFRLSVGQLIASLFRKDHLAEILMVFLRWFPGILPRIIQLTHGKPMKATWG